VTARLLVTIPLVAVRVALAVTATWLLTQWWLRRCC